MFDQHQKCIKAIELIETCNEYIANNKANIKRHSSLHWIRQMPGFLDYHEKSIKKYTAIRERLILYYSNQFMKLVDPVAESINFNYA